MSKAPPPPVKKNGPRAPPPPRITAKTFDNTELTKTLQQEQERPEKISQNAPSLPIENIQQNTQIQTNNSQIPKQLQIDPSETKLQNQIESQNFDQSIKPTSIPQQQISQNTFPIAKKNTPPIRKDIPAPNKKRTPAPPTIPKSVPPQKPNEFTEFNTESADNLIPTEEVPVRQSSQPNVPTVQTFNTNIQTQRDAIVQSATPLNTTNSVTSFSKNIPSPNVKPKTQIPPPTPKQNSQKFSLINRDKEQSPKNISNQITNLPIRSQQIQQNQKPQPKQLNLKTTLQVTSPQKKEAKSVGKSKLQQKLEKLRQAKEQMTQDINQQEQEEYQEQKQQLISDIPQQFVEEQINPPKIEKIKVTTKNEQQINPTSAPQQKLDQNSQKSFQSKNTLIETKSADIRNQQMHEQPKAKNPVPPPLGRVKTTPPIPIKNNIKNEKSKEIPITQYPEPGAKPQFQYSNQKKQELPIQQSKKQQIQYIQPKKDALKNVKIELTLQKQKQTTSTTQMHKLLERYHSLKSNYLSNIRQLEDQINFHKKKQQNEIEVINHIITELGKKNRQIKQKCGLKEPKTITSYSNMEENLAI